MMESTRIRPEFLVGSIEHEIRGSLEFDTESEFYSSPPDVKWNQDLATAGSNLCHNSESMSVNVDTGEEFFIDDLINFVGTDDNHKLTTSSPAYRSNHSTSLPLYIASKHSSGMYSPQVGSHPPVLPPRPVPVTRVASLDERAFTGHQHTSGHFSRLREALTTAATINQSQGSGLSRLAGQLPTIPRLPTQPVQCTRCGGELNSKCLIQACSKPDQTTCKICGQEMSIKCILAVCKQEL